MRKIRYIVILASLIALSCGCNHQIGQPVTTNDNSFGVLLKEFQEKDIVLPTATAKHYTESLPIETLSKETDCIFIDDKVNGHFWGSKQKQGSSGIESEKLLFLQNPYAEIDLEYPQGLPTQKIGSGKYVILQNRYIYEWHGYSLEQGYDVLHDVKLTRTDIKTGEISIIEERQLNTPLIYLHAIDENNFLSYYITMTESDKVEYATLAVAEIYNIDGTKKEIVREKYENDLSWSNSRGILLEIFTVYDGKIYGFGRRMIDGEYAFFLYCYNQSGELLNTQSIPDIENVIGDEQPLEFYLANDYIIIRTYETLTTYICKISKTGLSYIAKGEFGNLYYDILEQDDNAYIIFMESTVNNDATTKDKECPLYIINTKTDNIISFSIQTSLKKPYSTNMKLVADGDLILSFCESVYDPLQNKKFILTNEKLHQLLP